MSDESIAVPMMESVSEDGTPPLRRAGPGAALRAGREQQGLTVTDVAHQLKLFPRQVEALEADHYAALPGRIFVRGFVRNYARALGLDADALVREAESILEPAGSTPGTALPSSSGKAIVLPESAPMPGSAPRAKGAFPWKSTVAILIVVAVIAWIIVGREDSSGTISMSVSPTPEVASEPVPESPAAPDTASAATASTDTPAPVASVPVPAPEVVAPPPVSVGIVPTPVTPSTSGVETRSSGPMSDREIRLSFENESWIEIRDGTGRVILAQLNAPGSEQVVQGTPPFSLVIGGANGVKLVYRDRVVDLMPHTRTDVARLTLE
ncbi:MAG: helix-turn-helix domain-containing protein [Burkholderiales bacterium]|nr:helix-turn-helix domain-containing protein [Burkholderiales bacterium]